MSSPAPAVQAGRDIHARDIIVNKGLTETEILAIVEAYQRTDSPSIAVVAQLSKELGITETALAGFFRTLGLERVPPERLLETLSTIAERHVAMLARMRSLDVHDPTARALFERATIAIEQGDTEGADRLLAEVEKIELAASRQAAELAQEAAEAADARLVTAAEAAAQRANNKLQQLDYLAAAAHFARAANIVPASDAGARRGFYEQQAAALYRHGDEKGNNESLAEAIDIYTTILKLRTRERVPLDWAATQNNFGNALATLGGREGGTTRLEEAVEAYRAALLERTRERVPLDWATTQNNLGNALRTLGRRERGTARLEEAVEAYRAALLDRTRERVPLDWATTQNNLGNALATLGERQRGTARLEEAVQAFRAALLELTRERVPLDWAGTQNNLGSAPSDPRGGGSAALPASKRPSRPSGQRFWS